MSEKQPTRMEVAKVLNQKVSNVLTQGSTLEQFEKAFMISTAIVELQQMLSPEIMKPIMALQNNKLGFKTDKAEGYPEDVVKRAVIEATLSGLQTVGNQFNIISGSMYATKEGLGYLLKNIAGLHYEIIPSLPRINADKTGAAIVMRIKWSLNGSSFERDLEIPVKMNSFMGTDAVIGKATRKARKWLYDTITGSEIGEGDVTDTDFIQMPTTQQALPVVNKVEERILTLINNAQTVEELESYKMHVKPEHQEAFINKLNTFKK